MRADNKDGAAARFQGRCTLADASRFYRLWEPWQEPRSLCAFAHQTAVASRKNFQFFLMKLFAKRPKREAPPHTPPAFSPLDHDQPMGWTGRLRRLYCVIPVYNNAGTVVEVVRRALAFLPVLIVDDGSTDLPATELQALGVTLLRHPENRGKGAAILTATEYLAGSADYIITLDADGQHDPADLEKFIPLLESEDDLLIVGCRDFSADHIPQSSKKGRKISNFWFYVETGVHCSDCQSGFRAYPVSALLALKSSLTGRHYDFETEVLTRCVWGGLRLLEVDISVHYPKEGKRITHFRPFLDNLRISLIHSKLVGLRLLPLRRKKLVKQQEKKTVPFLRHPLRTIKEFLLANPSPGALGAAAAVGTFLAVLPIPGFHSVAIGYVCARLKLNALCALAIQNLFMPPLTPALCVEAGYFLLHGKFLTEISVQTLWKEIHLRFLEWLLGSLILAPVFATIMGFAVYFAALPVARRIGRR